MSKFDFLDSNPSALAAKVLARPNGFIVALEFTQ